VDRANAFLRSCRPDGDEEAACSGPVAASKQEGSDRLLIVSRELMRGDAAYLALRYAPALSARVPVDILVSGRCDDDFLGEFPETITIHQLDETPIIGEADWRLAWHRFAPDHAGASPFCQQYRAVLATSTFPNLAACAAVSTVQIAGGHIWFLVSNGLAETKNQV
jgi:hypothetical protein